MTSKTEYARLQASNREPVRIVRRLIAIVTAAALLLEASAVRAADPQPDSGKKPDFAPLDALLKAGDYEAAVAAADAIAEAVKPAPKDDDYLPRSIELIRALMRKGYAELRRGHPDDAETAFAEVSRIFKDKEFQRLALLATRQTRAGSPPWLVDLELTWIDLLSFRAGVLIERLNEQATRWEADEGVPENEATEIRGLVKGWLDERQLLRKSAAEARDAFVKRFGAGVGVVATSPYAKSLVGPFRESLLDGITDLEKSRLPASALPPDEERGRPARGEESSSSASPQDERSRLRASASGHLEAAAAALDDIVAAVRPKTGGLRPEIRVEVALLEAELLTARARLLIESGDLARARADVEKVLELRREVGTLQKLPTPDAHPELCRPLLMAAEIGVVESQRLLDAGKVDEARAVMEKVETGINQADRLTLPEGHSLRSRLAAVRESLGTQRGGVETLSPRSNAVEAATRRLIRGLEASAVPAEKALPLPRQPVESLP